MATEIEGLFFKISAVFDESFRQLKTGIGSQLDEISSKFSGAGTALTVGLTVPITAAAGAALKLGSDMMQARIGFETMLGSAEKANKFLGELQQFAAKTPFDFGGLRDAATKMMALGIESSKVLPTLRVIGDQVAAMGKSGGEATQSIDRITLALGQMSAKGKVSAQEMNQLAEGGIKAWDSLAKGIGVSIPEAMKLAEKGAIDAATAIPAILGGMAETTGGMMDKLSDTVIGRFSNLKDTIAISLTKIGEALLPLAGVAVGVFEKLADGLAVVADWFTKLSPTTQAMIVVFAGLAAAIGPVLLVVGQLAGAIVAIQGAIAILAGPAAVGAAIAAFKILAIAAAAAAAAFAVWKIGEWLYSFGPVKTVIDAVGQAIRGMIDWIAKLPGVSHVISGMQSAWQSATGAIDKAVSSVTSSTKAFQAQGPSLTQLGAAAAGVIPKFDAMGAGVESAAKKAAAAAKQMQDHLNSMWKSMSAWLLDMPKTFEQAGRMISEGFNIDAAIKKTVDEMQKLRIEFGQHMPTAAKQMYDALDVTKRQLETFAAVAEQMKLEEAFTKATAAVIAYGSETVRIVKEQSATIQVLNQASMQGAADAIARVQGLDNAFKALGVTWSDTLAQKAMSMKVAYDQVAVAAEKGLVRQSDLLQAQAKLLEAQIAAIKAAGGNWGEYATKLKIVDADLQKLGVTTEAHAKKTAAAGQSASVAASEMGKAWGDFGKQVSTIWTDLGADIAKSVIYARDFGDAFTKAAQAVKEAFVRHILEGGIKAMMKGLDGFSGMLDGIGKQITGLFGGLFGGGGGGNGPSIPGGGGPGPGSIGGALTGQLTGLITGITSAITGVINVFQTRRMEADIGKIEVTMRGVLNQIISIQETLNNYLPYMENTVQLMRLEGIEQALYSLAGGQMFVGIGDAFRSGFEALADVQLQGLQILINEVGTMRETMRGQLQVVIQALTAIYNVVSKPEFQGNPTSGNNNTQGAPSTPLTSNSSNRNNTGQPLTVNVTSNAPNPYTAGLQLGAGLAAGGLR